MAQFIVRNQDVGVITPWGKPNRHSSTTTTLIRSPTGRARCKRVRRRPSASTTRGDYNGNLTAKRRKKCTSTPCRRLPSTTSPSQPRHRAVPFIRQPSFFSPSRIQTSFSRLLAAEGHPRLCERSMQCFMLRTCHYGSGCCVSGLEWR